MKFDQKLVNKIVKRARESQFGLEDEPHTSMDYSNYAHHNTQSLAMILVGGFHDKYDLISIFQAAMDEIIENYENN